MKRVVRLLAVLLCAGALLSQERFYVVQSSDESLGEVTLGTGAVNSHVLTLGYLCNDILMHGTRLYVTNSGLNNIQEIDATTNATLRTLTVVNGVNPYSGAFINDDTLAVTNWVSNNLVLIRISDGASVSSVPVGLGPEGIVVQGDCVYVCLTRYQSGGYGQGMVMVLDRHSLQAVDSIPVGTNPQYVAVDDRNRLHVVCTGDYGNIPGQINVIDLSNLASNVTLAVGGTPANVSFGGGLTYVAAGGWGVAGSVFCYRLDDLSVLNGSTNPIAVGPGASDIEARPDSSFYVSCFMANQVEHRAPNGELLATYLMSTGPGQMVLYPGASGTSPRQRVIPMQIGLAEAYPNPFNGSVRLRLSAPAAQASSVLIYNELGRKVAEVGVAAGESEILWSPQTASGSTITSGIYYAVWEQVDPKSVQKLIYLK